MWLYREANNGEVKERLLTIYNLREFGATLYLQQRTFDYAYNQALASAYG